MALNLVQYTKNKLIFSLNKSSIMKKVLFTISLFSFVLFPHLKIKAQACCGADYVLAMLVQSGINGGYGIQYYNPAGFNRYIDAYNLNHAATLKTKMNNFGTALGFKVGANVAQIEVNNFLIGLKAAYHQMNEKNSATADITPGVQGKREFDLTLRTFGIGLSAAYIATKRLDIKFLDIMMTWNSASLKNKYSDPTTSTEEKLKSIESSIGFSAGAGLTFYPLPPYIAIEGTVGYAFFSIDQMQFENSPQYLSQTPNGTGLMTDFVESGGLFGFVQLNLAIPFN
jgi:hypothetical protein